MFGKNLKYILILAALAILTFTNRAVLDAISSGMAYTQEQAAVGDIFGHARPGFSFRDLFRVEVRDSRVSSSLMMRGFASTTRPMMYATSTRPLGDKPEGKEQDRRLTPEQVITILFKAGIIPQNKLDQARRIINGAHMSSTTMGMVIREEVEDKIGTSTRMMPPPPPLPPEGSTTIPL